MKQMRLEVMMYTGFELHRSARAKLMFLEQKERVVPCAEPVARIEPYAPQVEGGRPPFAS